MANESQSRQTGSIERGEPVHSEKKRMKAGYGRESVGHPDDTGIRRGNPGEMTRKPDVNTGQGPSSRQTSTAEDMSGQV